MNITPEELKTLVSSPSHAIGQTTQDLGQNIAVLDRGFVYVGQIKREGYFVLIENARNIRVWGTTNGLGELRNGPLKDTKLDVCGTVKVPFHALQHLITCNGF